MSLSTGVSSLSTAIGAKIKEIITTLSGKQATLVSGTNIKTINGTTVLGSGDLTITSGVSSVTGTAPIVSSGGATPAISHSTADGYLHIPATYTTNNGKFLQAGATAGSVSWVSASEVIGLADLNNVTITTPTSGQVLNYNGTSWVNATASGGLQDTAHSFSTNGYQKLSNGLIIQWGRTAVNVSSVTNISFPIVFPTALFSVTALHQTDGSQSYLYQVDSPTTSYFRVRWDRPSGGDPQAPVHFIAMGY